MGRSIPGFPDERDGRIYRPVLDDPWGRRVRFGVQRALESPFVRLTPEEIAEAEDLARSRQEEAVAQGRHNRFGLEKSHRSGIALHRIGAFGERAVYKHLGVPWTTRLNLFKDVPNMAGNVEIQTRSDERYSLLVRPKQLDKLPLYHVLALWQEGWDQVIVDGWIETRDCVRDEWVKTYAGRPPVYVVPRKAMNRDIAELRMLIQWLLAVERGDVEEEAPCE